MLRRHRGSFRAGRHAAGRRIAANGIAFRRRDLGAPAIADAAGHRSDAGCAIRDPEAAAIALPRAVGFPEIHRDGASHGLDCQLRAIRAVDNPLPITPSAMASAAKPPPSGICPWRLPPYNHQDRWRWPKPPLPPSSRVTSAVRRAAWQTRRASSPSRHCS